jgi:hypothetical protein
MLAMLKWGISYMDDRGNGKPAKKMFMLIIRI